MGAEGGVAWLVLRAEENREEVTNLLAMVGIFPSTGGRQEVDSWMSGETRETDDSINSTDLSCWEVLPDEPHIVDEWNNILSWFGLLELGSGCDLWGDLHGIVTGEINERYPDLGLGPDSTFADVAMEVLTNPWVEDPCAYGVPLHTLREGMRESWRYQGGWREAVNLPANQMRVADWCARMCDLVVTYRERGSDHDRPCVNDHEVWT